MNSKRILIVDDDLVTRQMLKLTLHGAGYQTVEAADGFEALRIITKEQIRTVISDWNMPKMNGLELCEQIRRNDLNGYVYAILLTSQNELGDCVAGLAAGADDFINKPFNPQELLHRVAAGQRILQLETREALIFSLAKLAESRDTETGHHLERVQLYSRLLARRIQLNHADQDSEYGMTIDSDFIQLLFQTSPLHDIGKVGIPDAILLHPGKLTPQQFDVMKTHTTIGADCLKGAVDKSPDARFLKMAHDIALHHHERFDGGGYPHGLKANEIPLAARIVSVADVYDALRSQRVYKPSFDHCRACHIISEERGKQFDPAVVDAFLSLAGEFARIAQRFDADSPTDNHPRISESGIPQDSDANSCYQATGSAISV